MDLFEALYTTRAMRRMKPDPIPSDVQSSILDAAIRAPSGGNVQAWRFLLLDDGNTIAELGKLYRDAFRQLKETRYVAVLAAIEKDPNDPEFAQDAKMLKSGGYLADHFEEIPLLMFSFMKEGGSVLSLAPAIWSSMLAARGHGVGSALTNLLTTFHPKETASLLGVPEGWINPCAVAFGYPKGRWGIAQRKPAGEVAYRNSWGNPAGLADGPLWAPQVVELEPSGPAST